MTECPLFPGQQKWVVRVIGPKGAVKYFLIITSQESEALARVSKIVKTTCPGWSIDGKPEPAIRL